MADAILAGTLSDADTLAELQKRRDIFIADPDLLPIRSRGLVLFNAAIDTDAPKAIANGQRAVLILQQVLKAIGSLYLESEQRQTNTAAPADESSSAPGPDTNGLETGPGLRGQANGAAPVYGESTHNEEPGKGEAHSSRLDTAAAAGRKRKLRTHGTPKKAARTSSFTQCETSSELHDTSKIASRPSQVDQLPLTTVHTTSRQRLSPLRVADADNKQSSNSHVSSKHMSTHSARPSLIVRLKVPQLSSLLAHQMTDRKAQPRRKNRKKYKSAELTISDMEDSNVEMRDTPIDDPKAPNSNNTRTRSSHSWRASRKSRAGVAKPSTASSDSWETASANSDSPSVSSAPTPSPPRPKRKRTNDPAFAFPPFPKMPPKDRTPFHKGAQIALENLLDDHAEAPQESLLELVEESQNNQPTVYDWERKTILKGGAYVFAALRGVCEEVRGKGKGKEVDAEEVVRGMIEWVDEEYERVWKG